MQSNQVSRYRPLIVATAATGAAIIALWVKWGIFSPSIIGWPRDHPLAIAALFTAGVMLGFGAAVVNRPRWRVAVQVLAVVCFVGMLVLPVDFDRWLPAPTYRYRHDEERVTIRAKPTVEIGQYMGSANIVEPGAVEAPIRLYLGRALAESLPTGRVLEFTLWKTRDVLLPGWRVEGHTPPWSSELESIRDGDRTLFDARICPIHHVTMQRVELPIHYGLPAFDPAWDEFGGGPGFVLGGCVVMPQRTEMGYRCPQCVARYAKWVAEISKASNR